MANAACAAFWAMEATVVGGKPILVFPELDAEDVEAFCRMMKWCGTNRLNELLPKPLVGKVNPETNDEHHYRPDIFAHIWAVDPDGKHEKVLVWRVDAKPGHLSRSIKQGIQEDCDWATEAIARVLGCIYEMWCVAQADAKVEHQTKLAARAEKTRVAHEHYAAMLERS
jgi:hypothetical protein